ncbi:hypothetical protein ACMFBJ_27820 [Escherichia coli]
MPSPRIRKMSLSRALDKYLKTVSVHKKGHQQEFYRSNVIKRYPIALRNMDEITTVDIATYRDVRLAEINPRTGKPITGNTVRLELALLSSLFNIARVEWGTCRTNPVELVRKPKVSSGRDRRLTSSEERRLSRYFREKNLMLYVIFHLALETAMRQGEILALRWEHIDLSKLDARRRQTQKVAAWFVPYPAHITTINEENGQKAHRIEIGDFDNLHVTATTKEEAVHRASEVLLRTLAIAAQKGERVPSPGALPVNDPDYIMICPLNPGSTPL